MNRERLFEECARLASGSGTGAVASVGRRRGSLPMSATAKMVVTAGGARFGTVGGGCLEAEITERALEVAQSRIPAVSEHTLNSDLAGDYGLTCGGTAAMFIEPVYGNEVLASVYGECAALLTRGERGVLVTGSDWSTGIQKILVRAGSVTGTGGEKLAAEAARVDSLREEPELRDNLLVEPLAGAPRLVVFGAGHVGARVAQAAEFAGWRVTVADDRPEFADPVRLPFAERTLVCDYGNLPEELGIDAATYVVICTRGHQHDALIAEQISRRDTRYLGMLGSRRKVALTWRLLESWGVPPERLALAHAPVGMAIGADTPEEIAISVVAEMIAVRRAKVSGRAPTG
ncbi:MAG: XdhC family protein [Gemmatimonadaceae bacterium]